MADIANLRPTADAPGSGFTYGMGEWIRTGGGGSSPYLGCDEASLNEGDAGYAVARTGFTTYNPGAFEFYLTGPPTGVTISSLSIKAYLRYSCSGPDFFAEYPRVKGFVKPASTRYYQSGPSYVTVTQFCNRNTTGDAGTFGIYTLGTWATNPATAAAWTLADLAAGTFIAGIEAGGVAEGQAANGIPHAYGGSGGQFDVGQFWVEITTTPSETFVNPIRLSASAILRLLGRPLRIVEFSAPAKFSGILPGDSIYLTHPFYPTEDGQGAGDKDWQRRPVKVLEVTDSIEPHEVRVRAIDVLDRACLFWSTWRTDIGADTVNLSGIPRFDQGGGYTSARSTSDWVHRPQDKNYVSISANKPRITPWGLLIQGGTFSGYTPSTGEHVAWSLNNTFSQGSGGHGTNIPAASPSTVISNFNTFIAGTGTLTVEGNRFLLDGTGYQRGVKATTGSPYSSNYGFVNHSAALGASNGRVRITFSLGTGATDPKTANYLVRRNTGGTNYDWLTSGWSTSLAWRAMANGETSVGGGGKTSFFKFGNFYEFWTDQWPIASTSTVTIQGIYWNQNNATHYLHTYASHYGLGTGQAIRMMRRELLVTTGSAHTEAADIFNLNNDSGYRIALADRGTLSFVFIPRWDHEDLEDGSVKRLITLMQDDVNGDRDVVFYSRTNGVSASLIFRRVYGAVTDADASLALAAATGDDPRTLFDYFNPIKITVRWTGAAGELGLAPKTLDVFASTRNPLTGAWTFRKGTSATAANYCRQVATGCHIAIGSVSHGAPGSVVGATPATFADGYFSDMEIRGDVLSDTQVQALHNRIGQNLDLPTPVA